MAQHFSSVSANAQPITGSILVTGGAGFIGSNLVDALLDNAHIKKVRVLDNLSTGNLENIAHHLGNPKFEFMEGDICDFNVCMEACAGMDWVSHQAALGSVPRSLADPLTTHNVNITGMLNVLHASKETQIKRVVYAASSSTYGDSKVLPKTEEKIGKPLSPYAVTKLVNELYATVYHRNYGLEVIGLRYFNVFGPRQSPDGAYAAAIPLFINQLKNGATPTIHGDGSNSRDFTYVDNVVQANLCALFSHNPQVYGEVFNIACGVETTLLELYRTICLLLEIETEPVFGPARLGDIPRSLADIFKARHYLGYEPIVGVAEGLARTVDWHRRQAKLPSLETIHTDN